MLGELVDAGKVRWIGSSTFAAWMVMEELAWRAERELPAFGERATAVQPARPAPSRTSWSRCVSATISPILPWSPIGGGVLSGRYDAVDEFPEGSRAVLVLRRATASTEPGLRVAAAVAELARERG